MNQRSLVNIYNIAMYSLLCSYIEEVHPFFLGLLLKKKNTKFFFQLSNRKFLDQ